MTEGPGTIETQMFLEVTRSPEIKQPLESGQPMGGSASHKRLPEPSSGSVPTARRLLPDSPSRSMAVTLCSSPNNGQN